MTHNFANLDRFDMWGNPMVNDLCDADGDTADADGSSVDRDGSSGGADGSSADRDGSSGGADGSSADRDGNCADSDYDNKKCSDAGSDTEGSDAEKVITNSCAGDIAKNTDDADKRKRSKRYMMDISGVVDTLGMFGAVTVDAYVRPPALQLEEYMQRLDISFGEKKADTACYMLELARPRNTGTRNDGDDGLYLLRCNSLGSFRSLIDRFREQVVLMPHLIIGYLEQGCMRGLYFIAESRRLGGFDDVEHGELYRLLLDEERYTSLKKKVNVNA